MSKFILVGGYPHRSPDGGKSFCQEMLNGVPHASSVLVCYFAREERLWPKLFSEDKAFFQENVPSKEVHFICANAQTFLNQLEEARVVFFKGGSTTKLMQALQLIPGWENKLAGKTVAGTSAGANMLCRYFAHLTDGGIGQGFGLLPYKVLVHYLSDYNAPNVNWAEVRKELENIGEALPLLTLGEGQYQVLTVGE